MVRKPEGMRLLQRLTCRGEDIKLDMKEDGMAHSGYKFSEQTQMAGFCGHSYETSGSIKDRELLDWLRNYQILKNVTPWSWLEI
jgi:hypothetical protein